MEDYKALIPHEIGHQYFWEYVLDDEWPGWLGLGLSISLDREYSQYQSGVKSFHKRMIDRYIESVSQKKNTTMVLPEEEAGQALNGENNEYGDQYHGNICHGKSFSVLSMLIDVIGKECYFNAMRHILKNYGGRVLQTPEFIHICEEFSGMNLNWFFHPWLKSNKSLSYSLENITETESEGIYTVTAEVIRRNALAAPVCVAVYFEDGSSQTQLTERLLTKQTLSFKAKSRHTKILFDPFEAYAMIPFDEKTKDDCAELLMQNIKETGYTDPFDLSSRYYERYQIFNIEAVDVLSMLLMQLFDSRHYNESIRICEDIISGKESTRYHTANAYRWIGMNHDMLHERGKAIDAYQKALCYKDIQFGDRHDQYGLHVTREWIQERLLSPFVRI